MKTVLEQISELQALRCGRCCGRGSVGGHFNYMEKKQEGGTKCPLCDGTGEKPAGIRTYTMTFMVEAQVEVRDPLPGEDPDKYFEEVVYPAFGDVNFGDATESDPTRHRAGEVWCENEDDDEYGHAEFDW